MQSTTSWSKIVTSNSLKIWLSLVTMMVSCVYLTDDQQLSLVVIISLVCLTYISQAVSKRVSQNLKAPIHGRNGEGYVKMFRKKGQRLSLEQMDLPAILSYYKTREKKMAEEDLDRNGSDSRRSRAQQRLKYALQNLDLSKCNILDISAVPAEERNFLGLL